MGDFQFAVFNAPDLESKLKLVEAECQFLMTLKEKQPVTLFPQRDILILPSQLHPAKKGFSTLEGQARLLHDLANIELQAMELGLRTLYEFPEAPLEFREELVRITLEEAKHLGMCVQGLQDLGFQWGSWPIHLALWDAVSEEDSLLDRIFIVHRYLEGSGLDAGDVFARRLHGVLDNRIEKITRQITEEEIDHVYFGSRWYRNICQDQGIRSSEDLSERIERLRFKIPKRVEKLSHRLRLQAGFYPQEIETLENLRQSFLAGSSSLL